MATRDRVIHAPNVVVIAVAPTACHALPARTTTTTTAPAPTAAPTTAARTTAPASNADSMTVMSDENIRIDMMITR